MHLFFEQNMESLILDPFWKFLQAFLKKNFRQTDKWTNEQVQRGCFTGPSLCGPLHAVSKKTTQPTVQLAQKKPCKHCLHSHSQTIWVFLVLLKARKLLLSLNTVNLYYTGTILCYITILPLKFMLLRQYVVVFKYSIRSLQCTDLSHICSNLNKKLLCTNFSNLCNYTIMLRNILLY